MKPNRLFTKTLFLSLLAMATLFVACKDDDKEPENVDTNPIVGTWQLNGLKTTAGADLPQAQMDLIKSLAGSCLFDLKVEFTASNKVNTKDCTTATTALAAFIPLSANTEWKVSNETLTLTANGTEKSFPITQTDKELKVNVAVNLGTPATAVMVFNKL
jgi:hypothetical protein